MQSPTLTSTPSLLAAHILVLDQQRHVVADLGSYLSTGTVTAISAGTLHFVPEKDRLLAVTDNNGVSFSWNGAGDGSTALPNGYYRIQVQSPGGSLVEAEVYLEHQPWQAGTVLVSLLPGASFADIRWAYSEAVDLRFDLYNLAGELIWQGRERGQNGAVRWGLDSASGQPVSDGIYLLKVQASSLDGSVDDIKIIKLAVTR